jgi:hypothetical protein
MFVTIDIGIKYTTELNLCRSTLFSQTYYTLYVAVPKIRDSSIKENIHLQNAVCEGTHSGDLNARL